MSTKTEALLSDSSHPMPVGVYVLFGAALLALSLGLAYLNYIGGIAIIDLQRLPDSLKDMRKLQLALVISACILLLLMGALYSPDHFGRVYLTWAVALAFCLEGYEALVYYQAAQSASHISQTAATTDASNIAGLQSQIKNEEATASTADALALRNGRSDIIASRQDANTQLGAASAARSRAASLRQQLTQAQGKQAAPSDNQIFGEWTTEVNMLKALLLFLLSVTMSGFAGRNLRFAYAAHLRAAAAAALDEHAKTGKLPEWMARRGMTPAAVALALGMGAAGAHAAQAPVPSPAGYAGRQQTTLLTQASLPKVTIALPTQASLHHASLARTSKANEQGTASSKPKAEPQTPKTPQKPQDLPQKQAQTPEINPEPAIQQATQAKNADLAHASKANEQGKRARQTSKARASTALPDGQKVDTGTTPGTDSRYQAVRAAINSNRLKSSVPAIQAEYGGGTMVARRYLQAMHAAGELDEVRSANGVLMGYKRAAA